jgi:hypothetical protein
MKKFDVKSCVVGLVVGGLVMVNIPTFAANKSIQAFYNNIKLSINNKDIKFVEGEEPFIVNGRTFLPAKYVAEGLGATIKWNETTNTVEVTSNQTLSKSTTSNSTDTQTNDGKIVSTPDGITKIDTWEGKQYIGSAHIQSKAKEKGYDFIFNIETKTWQIIKDKNVIYDNVQITMLKGYGYGGVEINYYINTVMPLFK